MRKMIIYLMMLIVLCSFVSGIPYWCYQNIANESTSCGGLNTGTYNWTGNWSDTQPANYAFDKNWSSYGRAGQGSGILPGTFGFLLINYTIPSNTSSALVEMILGLADKNNYSMPEGCYNGSVLQLNLTGYSVAGVAPENWLKVYCWNESWAEISPSESSPTIYYNSIYEVSVWWNRSIALDNCSIYNVNTLNVSILNESTDVNVIGDMNFWFNYNYEGLYDNYSTSVQSISNLSFCISEHKNLTADILIDYTVAGTYYEYQAYQLKLTNITQILNLYTQEGTTAVTFTVKDIYDDELENVYIKILKFDIGDNTYKTTEIIKTNSDGEAVGNIVLSTTWYRFIIEYNGFTYRYTEPSKIFSSTKSFTIDLIDDDWFDGFDVKQGVSTVINFTNSTKNFVYTWNDPSGAMHYGCLKVIQRNRTSDFVVCDNCSLSTAATVLCGIGTNVEGNSYIGTGYMKFDVEYITDILEIVFFGGDFVTLFERGAEAREFGVFLSFLLIGSFTLLGVWAPVTAIVMMLAGFFFVATLGFLAIKMSMLFALIGIGIVVIVKISRSR